MRRLGVALLLVASTGIAKNRPRALTIAEWRGAWQKPEKQKVLDALAIGIDAAGLDRVDAQTSGFDIDARFRDCLEREACRFEYARATDAQYVFVAIFVKQGGGARASSSAVMTFYNVPLLAEATVAVKKGKGVQAAVAGARTLVGDLLSKERRLPRGTLEVASAPPGDSVFIDGHAAGLTNLSKVLYAGPHVVRIERLGVAPHITKVDVLADKLVHYEARFEKNAVPR